MTGTVKILPTDLRIVKCGYAKVTVVEDDRAIDYYLQKYSNTIGRRNKKEPLDIPLDESNAAVSRSHARIFYDFEAKKWKIEVFGKSGMTIHNTLYKPAQGGEEGEEEAVTCVALESQTNIKIGNALLWFLLPESNKLQFLEKDWSQRELPQANPQQQQVQQSQNPLQKNLSTELEEAAVKGDEME